MQLQFDKKKLKICEYHVGIGPEDIIARFRAANHVVILSKLNIKKVCLSCLYKGKRKAYKFHF